MGNPTSPVADGLVARGLVASAYAAAAAQLRGSLDDALLVLADSVEGHGVGAVLGALLLGCAEQMRELSNSTVSAEDLAVLMLSVARDGAPSALCPGDVFPRILACVLAELRGDHDTRDLLIGRLDDAYRADAFLKGGAATLASMLRWHAELCGTEPVSLARTCLAEHAVTIG
jgi:hypothetical protein